MKEPIINVTAQSKAIFSICSEYVSDSANQRYIALHRELLQNPTISLLLSLAGEAMMKEESELQKDFRTCLPNSRELKLAVCRLMGW